MLTTVLAACGGGESGSPTPPAPGPVAADVAYLSTYMRDWYLWRDRMPSPDLASFPDARAALKALTVPEDRYSYIDDAQVFNDFFDEGRTLGFGIGYLVRGEEVWLRLVQPNSPAAAAGLRRGDRILAIDGTPSETLIAENRLDAAFGPAQVGHRASFRIARAGQPQTIEVVKQNYAIDSVLAAGMLAGTERPTGYVNLYAFNTPARAAWSQALARLLAAGARDIVVDLRENSGGLLHLANEIASSLAPADAPGKLFVRSEYNSGHSTVDTQYRFFAPTGLGRFERVTWLTSERTCSAAESLIVGLRPYRHSVSIGATTCGKPVGFNPEQRDGKVYSIVTFRLVNSAGETDYYTGLAPTCALDDDLQTPFGDPTDPLIAAALAAHQGRPCPDPPVGKQPLAPVRRTARWDLAAEIGLK